jgi:hypothetical protein
MFVPSLSWSNDRFYSQMALQKKWRFSRLLQGLQHHDLLLRRDDLRIHLRQTAFILSHLYIKMIFLPRQARGKHRERDDQSALTASSAAAAAGGGGVAGAAGAGCSTAAAAAASSSSSSSELSLSLSELEPPLLPLLLLLLLLLLPELCLRLVRLLPRLLLLWPPSVPAPANISSVKNG